MSDDRNGSTSVTRREFAKTTAAAGIGALIGGPQAGAAPAQAGKTRYGIVGVGSRSGMYQTAINQKEPPCGQGLPGCLDCIYCNHRTRRSSYGTVTVTIVELLP